MLLRRFQDGILKRLGQTGIWRFVCTVAFAAGCSFSEVKAQSILEQWDLHSASPEPARRGTWLDDLRRRNEGQPVSTAAESDTARLQDLSEDNEFPLEAFQNLPSSSTRRRSGFQMVSDEQAGQPMADPAEPVPPVPEMSPIPDSGLELPVYEEKPELRRDIITPGQVFREAAEPCYEYHMLPGSLLFHSYLAGEKEPRMQFLQLYDMKSDRRLWEAVLGGRVGIFRYGEAGPKPQEAFQIDLEGAVFARVLPDEPSAMLESSDYRAGLLGTWRFGNEAYKAGYYHISSHAGDEFLLANPAFNRLNYVRDAVIVGTSRDFADAYRLYGEIAYAIGAQGGAEPWELQFGGEYTPAMAPGLKGAPFAAVNSHYREEFGSRLGVNFNAGWGWQGEETLHRLRVGLNLYSGPSLNYQRFDEYESLIGGGIWFDF